jgi:hypothetical protein
VYVIWIGPITLRAKFQVVGGSVVRVLNQWVGRYLLFLTIKDANKFPAVLFDPDKCINIK